MMTKIMATCPKCNSNEIYRKHHHDLKIYCDRCGFHWQSKQVLKPLLSRQVNLRYGPNIRVQVWLCPADSSKYSFGFGVSGGIAIFNEFEDDPYLSGSYDSPQAALDAGVAEAKNNP